jgi:cytochrome d ubiquinol oxidase subunit II
MAEIWYVILAFMLTAFAVLAGWDFGAGAVLFLVGRTPRERRVVIGAIGPLWTWNEVWLVASGGVFVLAFPKLMATAFSGFYLALMLVLWCLILRGIALELGGHVNDPMWRSLWDFVFASSNILLAILFGAAVGNVLRGVPLGTDGTFSLELFTDFRASGHVGTLDWYTLLLAVFTLVSLAAHGASYLRLKTRGPVEVRSARLSKVLWPAAFVLLAGITAGTAALRPDLVSSMGRRPLAWVFAGTALGGAIAAVVGQRKGGEGLAFAGGCAFLSGLLGAGATASFPVMLYTTIPGASPITAAAGASSDANLRAGLMWWPFALLLTMGYAVLVARRYAGKVGSEEA